MTNTAVLGSIVVGVDGSPAARRALAWAIDQVVCERRPITLVHAVGPQGRVWMDQAGFDTRIGLEHMQTSSQRLLAEARAEVARRAPEVDVHEILRVADPRDVLLDLSRDAAMIVVGSRGRGRVRSLLLGSVGVAVTRHAECPVIVLRPGNQGLVRNGILVGADCSEHSGSTLEFAYRQASVRGLPLTVVHCLWDAFAAAVEPRLVVDAGAVEAQRLLLAESVAGMTEKFPDVPVRTEIARGLADASLVTMSQRMDMVVVGSHHGGPFSGLVRGSVAASVVEHATCAVAVVPISPA